MSSTFTSFGEDSDVPVAELMVAGGSVVLGEDVCASLGEDELESSAIV